MAMTKLSIFIPSYKRPEVLDMTLKGLYDNTVSGNEYNVEIYLALNKAGEADVNVAKSYVDIFKNKGILFKYHCHIKNVGKAKALNNLFDISSKDSDYIVTMDNDMVIRMPWLHYVTEANSIKYDIMGFCSSLFWAHDPIRERCPFINYNGFTFYKPYSVAGGMMLFPYNFLKDNKWTNHGGVYGRDDAEMCLRAKEKYVYNSEEPWLEHDPLKGTSDLLKDYEDKKVKLYESGITVFKDGWDE